MLVNIFSTVIVTVVIYMLWIAVGFLIMHIFNIHDMVEVKNKLVRYILFFPIYLTVGIKMLISKFKKY